MKNNSWSVLAAIRFILAAMVMTTHLSQFVYIPPVLSDISHLDMECAVIVFLIISGYSIAHSVNSSSTKSFYMRRIDRIYPTYFFAMMLQIVAFAIYGPIVHFYSYPDKIVPSPWDLIGSAFFLQGICCDRVLGVSWSLALEVYYYAMAPLIKRLRTRYIVLWALISTTAYYITAGQYFHGGIYGSVFIVGGWAWLFGFLIYRHKDLAVLHYGMLVTGLIVLIHGRCDIYGPVMYTTGLLLVTNAHKITAISCRYTKVMDYAGNLSYALYMVHLPVFMLLCANLRQPNWILCVATAFAMTIVVYHLIDKPYRSRAQKNYGKPSTTTTAHAASPAIASAICPDVPVITP